MSDYDFKTLNDKEFEILCVDLLGEVTGRRFERFKAGRDAGVDGRFFADDGKEVILQCKHWSNTPIKQLISALERTEKPKLSQLNPKKYILAVSNALSRADKKAIYRALSPHLLSESDIFGKEDLNDILKKNEHIEKRHYKLWLHSSSVIAHIFNNAIIGRSAFSLEEIIRSSALYVVTSHHNAALKVLEKLGVVIIAGEPGVGKTTLADHLCLHYIAQGFSYLRVADDIREAESAFDPDGKQVIYFDDFLGRNYLEALRGHEGNHITQFMRRVSANKNKRFVLTSRSTILNQGKLLIDSFDHGNIKKNEYELRITSLTDIDKAQILYNHIWHSGLSEAYIDQLYFQKRYRNIIDHKNFNPRLISYITDVTRLDECPPEQYWTYVSQSLTNPSQVWENPFVAQLDDFGRSIVILVVLNGSKIEETDLAVAYRRYVLLQAGLRGRQEFQANIRLLTGSFLNRTVSAGASAMIDLFNPSIGDYVLQRYVADITTLKIGMESLRTMKSISSLKSLLANEQISKENAKSICRSLIDALCREDFMGVSGAYVSSICELFRIAGGLDASDLSLLAAVKFVISDGGEDATDVSLGIVEWGVEQQIVTPEVALNYVEDTLSTIESKYEIRAVMSLLSVINSTIYGYGEVMGSAKEHVIELITEDFENFIDVDSAFANVSYGDHRTASRALEKLIEEELQDIGMDFCSNDVERILDSFDVESGLQSYFENSYDENDRRSEGAAALEVDEIDDLFDRTR